MGHPIINVLQRNGDLVVVPAPAAGSSSASMVLSRSVDAKASLPRRVIRVTDVSVKSPARVVYSTCIHVSALYVVLEPSSLITNSVVSSRHW